MNELPVPSPLRFSPVFAKTSGIAKGQTNQSIALLELKYATTKRPIKGICRISRNINRLSLRRSHRWWRSPCSECMDATMTVDIQIKLVLS